jgi:hypothetical protein
MGMVGTLIISAHGRLRQEDHLGYIVRAVVIITIIIMLS